LEQMPRSEGIETSLQYTTKDIKYSI